MAVCLNDLPLEIKRHVFDQLWSHQEPATINAYPNSASPSFATLLLLSQVNKAFSVDVKAYIDEQIPRAELRLLCWYGGRPLHRNPKARFRDRKCWLRSMDSTVTDHMPRISIYRHNCPFILDHERRAMKENATSGALDPLRSYLAHVVEVQLDVEDLAYLDETLDTSEAVMPNLRVIRAFWPEVVVAECLLNPKQVASQYIWQYLKDNCAAWLREHLLDQSSTLKIINELEVSWMNDEETRIARRHSLTFETTSPVDADRVLKLNNWTEWVWHRETTTYFRNSHH